MGAEDLNPLMMQCPRCEAHNTIHLRGQWETAPGETVSYEDKLEYEREHGERTVTSWPYFLCVACDLYWRGTKYPGRGFSTTPSPSPHAQPLDQAEDVGSTST